MGTILRAYIYTPPGTIAPGNTSVLPGQRPYNTGRINITAAPGQRCSDADPQAFDTMESMVAYTNSRGEVLRAVYSLEELRWLCDAPDLQNTTWQSWQTPGATNGGSGGVPSPSAVTTPGTSVVTSQPIAQPNTGAQNNSNCEMGICGPIASANVVTVQPVNLRTYVVVQMPGGTQQTVKLVPENGGVATVEQYKAQVEPLGWKVLSFYQSSDGSVPAGQSLNPGSTVVPSSGPALNPYSVTSPGQVGSSAIPQTNNSGIPINQAAQVAAPGATPKPLTFDPVAFFKGPMGYLTIALIIIIAFLARR